MIRVLLFGALLFLSAAPTHGMGLLKFFSGLVGAQQEEQEDCLVLEIQNAFGKTRLPKEITALILSYCPQETEPVLLRRITLPNAKKMRRKTFNYPKHAAISVSLEGFKLRVLNTDNKILTYDVYSGELLSEKAAKISWELLSRSYRICDQNYFVVFIAHALLQNQASSDIFEARIVGNMRDLRIGPNSCSAGNGTPLGAYYYDAQNRLSPDYAQPCSTIEVYKKSGPTVLAHILNIVLPNPEPVIQQAENKAAEDEREQEKLEPIDEQDLASF